MFFFDKIEKIKPLILLLLIILFISTLLPIYFYAPLNNTSETFNNENTSGSISFKLQKETIFFNLTVSSLNSSLLTSQTKGLQILISINQIKQYEDTYNLLGDQHTAGPLLFTGNFTLQGSMIFLLNIQLQTTIFLIQSANNSISNQNLINLIDINSIIGKINFPLYDIWFIIALISCYSVQSADFIIVGKKNGISLIKLIENFIHQSYAIFHSFLDKLDENSFIILLITPILLLVAILTQIYINYFSTSNQYSVILYNSKISFYILIYLYATISLYFPVLLNVIYDQFHSIKHEQKTRIKDNIIFLPLFDLLFLFILCISIILPFKEIMLILVLFSFIANVFIYYVSLAHHQRKYNYKFNKWTNFLYVSSFRLVNLIILYVLLEFFIFAQYSIPSYFLLF